MFQRSRRRQRSEGGSNRLICNLQGQTSRHASPVLDVVAGEARREYPESRSNPPAVPPFACDPRSQQSTNTDPYSRMFEI
ncbi:hypothetical protein Y032_0024g1039 [Ancylostoma ceylanicum]|uniref:Uncharacterized protein n=1 Tax=Ancylostoma ceylanicum TaxID=53326 RepID=A0A016UXZ9_9BILA|nr:hypothetical protein Y032_0024g1039 [Ancylostoma ceylanicum]